MPRRFTALPLLANFALATPAAFAHFNGSLTPHLHGSDLAGLAAVVALTIGAGWLDRRRARARRERDASRERATHANAVAGSRNGDTDDAAP